MPDTKCANQIFAGIDKRNSTVLAMIDYGICSIENLQKCNETFIDNPFSRYMQKINDWSEKAFPSFNPDARNMIAKTPIKGYKVSSDISDNGTTVEHYFYKDKEIASVIKDKKGKITSLSQYDVNKSNGKETRYFYGDINKDGKIDKGEVKVRYDIDLS